MIILDTNVISAMMKPEPDPALEAWMTRQSPDDLYISSITIAELMTGVLALPDGRKRDLIDSRVRRAIAQFGPNFPSFGREAAEAYAVLAATNPDLDTFDGQIAAIAQAHGAAIATRNTKHFRTFGIDLVDPWAA